MDSPNINNLMYNYMVVRMVQLLIYTKTINLKIVLCKIRIDNKYTVKEIWVLISINTD